MNRYGIVDNFTLGNQAVTSIDYDSYGFVDEITTIKNGTYLQNWSYDFNNITGNLTSRMGLNSSGGVLSMTGRWAVRDDQGVALHLCKVLNNLLRRYSIKALTLGKQGGKSTIPGQYGRKSTLTDNNPDQKHLHPVTGMVKQSI